MIWNIRDELNANLSNSQLKIMLEANEQTVTKSSESKVWPADYRIIYYCCILNSYCIVVLMV